jgi:hypothetical protein
MPFSLPVFLLLEEGLLKREIYFSISFEKNCMKEIICGLIPILK